MQFYTGRTLDGVTQVETIASYGSALVRDYARYTAGQAMLETAERLTPEEREPAVQQYLLLVGGLRALVSGEHESTLVLDAYLVRSLAVAGWAPSFDACARCGARGRTGPSTSPRAARCAPPTGQPGSASPSAETLELLGALLTGDWTVADASDLRARREAVEPGGGVPVLAARAGASQPAAGRADLTAPYLLDRRLPVGILTVP